MLSFEGFCRFLMDKDNFALVKENESQFRDVSTSYVVCKIDRHYQKIIKEFAGEMIFEKVGQGHLMLKGGCKEGMEERLIEERNQQYMEGRKCENTLAPSVAEKQPSG